MTFPNRTNMAWILVAALFAVSFVTYSETFASMAGIWFQSGTFMHGALILPMCVYLSWRKRQTLRTLPLLPATGGFLMLLGFVIFWVVGELALAQVVSQFAFVGMLGATLWAILGTQVVRVIRFSLAYAFFAVPFGEFLIPTLMEWTASFAVWGLQLTGVPVLREGLYFSLPSGNFEVIEACSGVRFLIVSVVLGVFFAHETYKSWQKRSLFVLTSALALIVANWVRAYLVVLIAHLTDMRFGAGREHIYFGWVLFLIAVFALFWFGKKFEDIEVERQSNKKVDRTGATYHLVNQEKRFDIVIAGFLSALIIFSGPILLDSANFRAVIEEPRDVELPVAIGAWSGPDSATLQFRPLVSGAKDIGAGRYTSGSRIVELHVAVFSQQRQGAELIGWGSRLFDSEKWRRTVDAGRSVDLQGDRVPLSVREAVISDGRRMLRIWYWYDIGGQLTSRPSTAKFWQLWNIVSGSSRGDALVALVTPVHDSDTESDSGKLEQFTREYLVRIAECMRGESSTPQSCTAAPAEVAQ